MTMVEEARKVSQKSRRLFDKLKVARERRMSRKKFVLAITIAKLDLRYYWAFGAIAIGCFVTNPIPRKETGLLLMCSLCLIKNNE